MTSSLSVLALVPYALDTTPSQRFRLEQWAPGLERAGYRLEFSPYFDRSTTAILQRPGQRLSKMVGVLRGFRQRQRDLRRAGKQDLLVVHRAAVVAGPAALDLAFLRLGVPAVFDFDDAIYLRNKSVNRLFDRLKFASKTAVLCRHSALVSAGSRYLAEWARERSRAVVTVPTSIDTVRYTPRRPAEARVPVVVGWTGSATTLPYLEGFAPILRDLASCRSVQFRVVSNRAPVLPGLPVDWRPWSAATEVDEISAFDIGIKPLPDDPWTRGKCPMKELQYMALQIPTVCSAVGASREAVRHGVTGFSVSSRQEWLRALISLIDSYELRREMGAAGRGVVEREYATAVSVRRFAEALGTIDRTPQAQGTAQ
ncbi:MAG TPA: glycosyltransferase [Solirubrobacteraceae bacterium]|nr:glycosyltransferase [Solirubrobacteraceae bacterium]